MQNMSYCRFENTYKALQECYEAMQVEEEDEDEDELSSEEQEYKAQLLQLCAKLATHEVKS